MRLNSGVNIMEMPAKSNAVQPISKQVHFGFNLSDEVETHLQNAARSIHDNDLSLASLQQAYKSGPQQLEVLVALYKFHFYRGDINNALQIVKQALVVASCQGGFSYDWKLLDADSADWNDQLGVARFYLYSLKALAFIRLRQFHLDEAKQILDVLQRLDPQDQVGAEVIRDLFTAIEMEMDEKLGHFYR